MTNTKQAFTPGPWYTIKTRGDRYIRCNGDLCVANVLDGGHCDVRNEIDEDTQDANARLISAAPDLFGALESLVASFDDAELSALTGEQRRMLDSADAVLAKARGETP